MENKIPDTSTLVRKTDYNTEINEIENKILDISDFDTKLRGVNSKITSNKTRAVNTETSRVHNFYQKTIHDLIKRTLTNINKWADKKNSD